MSKTIPDEILEGNTKQRFVDVTYHMILENGVYNLKVRDIAKKVGCSAPALYKHFESLDYLIMLASIRFLDDYIEELLSFYGQDIGSLDMELLAWRAFNKYAFRNPPVFVHMFWSKHSYMFEEAIHEYMQIFPIKPANHNMLGFFYSASFSGNMQERDYIFLRRAANEGTLRLEDAKYMSQMNNYIVQGMLMDHLTDYMEPGVAEKAAEECSELIQWLMDTYRLK